MYKFNYHKPYSLNQATEIFQSSEFPKYLAGGMTLIPSMKQKLSSPTDLIDLQNISDLKGIKIQDNIINIGAYTTHNEVAESDIVKNNIPALSYLANNIADNAVRNLGTIGGSICNSDPAADYPAAVLSLDAIISTNKREIEAKKFFLDMFETSLELDEIVTKISFPVVEKSKYIKFSSQASKYAIVGLFASYNNNKINLAVTGASNKVFNIKDYDNLSTKEVLNLKVDELKINKDEFNNDIHATASYRYALLKNMIIEVLGSFFNE